MKKLLRAAGGSEVRLMQNAMQIGRFFRETLRDVKACATHLTLWNRKVSHQLRIPNWLQRMVRRCGHLSGGGFESNAAA